MKPNLEPCPKCEKRTPTTHVCSLANFTRGVIETTWHCCRCGTEFVVEDDAGIGDVMREIAGALTEDGGA